MKVAVLDYSRGNVDLFPYFPDLETSEQVEDVLVEVYGYNLDEISYMTNYKNING